MLQFLNVGKQYPQGHIALENINFSLEKGEMAFLTGHSGAGKSSLLKLIALLEKCTEGIIKLAGKDVSHVSKHKALKLRRSMGIVFQQPYLLTDQNVFQNVALPLIIAGYSLKECIKPSLAALEHVGLLQQEKILVRELSIGEMQRLSIARAIVNKPKLLLADEPTGNLDPELSQEIIALFQQLNTEGMSVFIATHDLALIARLKHRIITLSKGRLIHDGKSESH